MKPQDALDWFVHTAKCLDHDCRTSQGDGCGGCADIEAARETLQAVIYNQADGNTIKEMLIQHTLPKVNGMMAAEVARLMLARLRERNRAVIDASNRQRATHPSETI